MKTIFLILAFFFGLIVYGQDGDHPLYQSYDVTEDSVFLPWAEGPLRHSEPRMLVVFFG